MVADWTDEEITVLQQKWNEGLSASNIAQFLTNHSRCSVIGKAHRLGLAKRKPGFQSSDKQVAPKKSHDAIYKTTHTKPLPPPPPPPKEEVKPTKRRVRLPREFNNDQFFQNWINNLTPRLPDIFRIPSTGFCKYIYGEVADKAHARWCGLKVEGEGSWCPHHKKLVYQPAGTYKLTKRRRRK